MDAAWLAMCACDFLRRLHARSFPQVGANPSVPVPEAKIRAIACVVVLGQGVWVNVVGMV